jgi:hypothetical protein
MGYKKRVYATLTDKQEEYLNLMVKEKKATTLAGAMTCLINESMEGKTIDEELTLVALKNLLTVEKNTSENVKLLFDFFHFWLMHWYAHTPQIPDEYKEASFNAGYDRLSKMLESFENSLREGQPSLCDRMKADLMEQDLGNGRG